ncbi:MAG TPA: alginate export family protein [Terriglobales bacterium]|nr:alginate export family protein [Terriglobales bacterium]
MITRVFSRWIPKIATIIFSLALLAARVTFAASDAAPRQAEMGTTAGSSDRNETEAAKPAAPPPAATSYYREAGSYSTKRETVPPAYVRNASKIGIDALKDFTWLDIGLDHRTRYELREDDYRRPVAKTDHPFLLRHRAYLGIRNILDPFRFVVEVEDARRENGDFPRDNRDVNEFEPIQLIGELHFTKLLPSDPRGNARPVSLRGGRMWFEKLDRRLIGNNPWRNTTNTFQGIHFDIGQDANDWQVEIIAAQPLDRLLYDFDEAVKGQWFYAAIGHWRGWSDIVTIEPYYLMLHQQPKEGRARREIHSPAVRLYGPIGKTRADYDLNFVYQTGRDAGRDHSAFGSAAEIGYTLDHPAKPRASVFYGYASGDKDPNDGENERFERFYGFGRPWSASDYFIWENVHAPKIRFEITPIKDLRIDAGFGGYWLASKKDRWVNANLRDPQGDSGSFIGHELDIRARYPINRFIDTAVGYSHFHPGSWTKRVGRDNPSDFFYLEISLNALPRS